MAIFMWACSLQSENTRHEERICPDKLVHNVLVTRFFNVTQCAHFARCCVHKTFCRGHHFRGIAVPTTEADEATGLVGFCPDHGCTAQKAAGHGNIKGNLLSACKQHMSLVCVCVVCLRKDGWMNSVLGHFYALSRLNWAGDNLSQKGYSVSCMMHVVFQTFKSRDQASGHTQSVLSAW